MSTQPWSPDDKLAPARGCLAALMIMLIAVVLACMAYQLVTA